MLKRSMSILGDLEIKKCLKNKEIVIDTFDESLLGNCSYDVTLGEYYYRPKKPNQNFIHNPYNENSIKFWFGTYEKARSIDELQIMGKFKKDYHWDNISEGINEKEDKIILLEPGETILSHTNEFIGGIKNITTMMKTKSSFGRNFIQVCKCAGWGDVGYVNRWTMEITNCSLNCIIPLVVGRPIAQIVFLRTGPCSFSYSDKGTYQNFSINSNDLTRQMMFLKQEWEPRNMLPKLYRKYATSTSPKLMEISEISEKIKQIDEINKNALFKI